MREIFKKFLDATDPTGSLRLAAYAVVICCSCGWLTYDLAIKTVSGLKKGIDSDWNVSFGLLLAAVSLTKVFGKDDNATKIT